MGNPTIDELESIKEKSLERNLNWIKVGLSTCGIAAGAKEVFQLLTDKVDEKNLDIEVKRTGCLGLCAAEPLVEVCVEGAPRVIYGKVDRECAMKIIERHVIEKRLVQDHVYQMGTEGGC